jgi:hypothetical protein
VPSRLGSRYGLPAGRNVAGVPSIRIRYLIVVLPAASEAEAISNLNVCTPAGGFVAEASGIAGPWPAGQPGVGTLFAVFGG